MNQRPRVSLARLLVSLAVLAPAASAQDPATNPVAYERAGRQLDAALQRLGRALCAPSSAGLAALHRPELPDEAPAGDVQGLVREPLPPLGPAELELFRMRPGESLGRGFAARLRFWEALRDRFRLVEQAELELEAIEALGPGGRVETAVRYWVLGYGDDQRRLAEEGRLGLSWVLDAEEQRIVGLEARGGSARVGPGGLFPDRAAAWGVRARGREDPRYQPPSAALRAQLFRHLGSGVTIGDVDGDGWDDLLLRHGPGLRLYLNREGRFQDATRGSGLEEVLHATACLLADFDGDGDPDLVVARQAGGNQLFRNQGRFAETGAPRFLDQTGGAGNPSPAARRHVFHHTSGLGPDEASVALAAADFDGDGRLDLYVGRGLDARRRIPETFVHARNGEPNRLYLGNGDLSFRDVSAGSGAADRGLALGVAVADYDRDGDADIYLSNALGRDVLLRNRGDAVFAEAPIGGGPLLTAWGGAAWGDVDGDGRLDLYAGGLRSPHRWLLAPPLVRGYLHRRGGPELLAELEGLLGEAWDAVGERGFAGSRLLRQEARGTFATVPGGGGAASPGWSWSSALVDLDHDGHLDLYTSAGLVTGARPRDAGLAVLGSALRARSGAEEERVYGDAFLGPRSWHGRQRDGLYLGRGDGSFHAVGPVLGLEALEDGRGLAAADLDHDGDLDLVLSPYRGPVRCLENTIGQRRAWLALRLRGTRCNREAIGAELQVRAGELRATRVVQAGQGYASQSSLEQVVGLGSAHHVDAVDVRWPGGEQERFGPFPVNQRLRLVQGGGRPRGERRKAARRPSRTGTPAWILFAGLFAFVAMRELARE